jgi:hypothetical protein
LEKEGDFDDVVVEGKRLRRRKVTSTTLLEHCTEVVAVGSTPEHGNNIKFIPWIIEYMK